MARQPAGKCTHAWMPPRSVPLTSRRLAISGSTYEFEDVRSQQPRHTWKHRWCLFCLDPHPMDAAKASREAV
jgi:hypothetical protein